MLLTAGKIASAGFDSAVETALCGYNIDSLRRLDCFSNFLVGSIRLSPFHVISDSAGEEHCTLRNDTDLIDKSLARIVGDIYAVNFYVAIGGIVEPRNKVNKAGFSRAGSTDNSNRFALFDRKTDIIKRIFARFVIAEANV